jgi:molybdopterin-synthase adenylyltransferase
MSLFFHEQLYRTSATMAQLRDYPVTVCGAGAVGANLTENLARTGFQHLKVIDRDRIEERNLSTQPYYRSDVGAFKAKILSNSLYRALGVKVAAETKELTAANAKQLLDKTTLIIDAFDNSVARQVLKEYSDATQVPCLHVGLAGSYAEVIWNPDYRVPSPNQDDICDYPLARNLVLLAVSIASEALIKFITTGETQSFTVTLKDLAIQPFV